jgi:hypothetical protein
MKIILNPKYEALRDYLKNIEEHFEHEGRDIHSGRNVIRSLKVNGLTICVKRFGPPSFRRKVQQMFYKKSKGKLAYLSPLLLRERGFESPESIAFVRCRHGLLRTNTYFVSLLSTYRYSMDTLHNKTADVQHEVIANFARYAARLHEDGFLHRDFSSSNILYDVIDGRYHFSLVDTNSMKCGSGVSIEAGCRNLAKLSGDDAFFAQLAECYAMERKADPVRCATLINEAREKLKRRCEEV